MNNFCVLPFNSVSISATGQLRQCCNGGHKGFDKNITNLSVYEIINNTSIVNMRKNFLDDIQDSDCDRCWEMESIGNRSFRHTANENKNYGLSSGIPIKKETTIDFDDIHYIDITLGNKCNLGCRMCNHFSSSLIAKHQIALGRKLPNSGLIDFDRNTKDKILELFARSKNLTTIYMLGGEPLINDFHDEIIDLLIQENRADKVTIQYSTNLQIDIEKYIPMWSKFKYIDLNISLDGCDETYEYIRWPGRWEKVFNNLIRACEFRKQANFYPGIATTVQNLNAHNIFELVDRCTTLGETYVPFYFIPVTGQNFLHIIDHEVLENEVKKLLTLPDPYGRITELIRQYKSSILKSKLLQKNEVESFFNQQKEFDLARNQNLFQLMPHFEKLADRFKLKKW